MAEESRRLEDRFARRVSLVAITVALVALILAGYAIQRAERREAQLESLSETLRIIAGAQRSRDVPLRGPPPALDTSE